MNTAKLARIREHYVLLPFGQDAIGDIGTHHVAIGKSGFGMKAIDPQKGLAKVHMLDA